MITNRGQYINEGLLSSPQHSQVAVRPHGVAPSQSDLSAVDYLRLNEEYNGQYVGYTRQMSFESSS